MHLVEVSDNIVGDYIRVKDLNGKIRKDILLSEGTGSKV